MENDNKNSQTNIEKADEVAGYLSNLGLIPMGKVAPYVGFLSSNPVVLTSFGVLAEKMNNDTATRSDYVQALTSLGNTAFGVANLVRIGLSLNPITWGTSVAVGLALATLEYADSRDYSLDKIGDDFNSIKNDIVNKIDKLKENISSNENIKQLDEIIDKYFGDTKKQEETLTNDQITEKAFQDLSNSLSRLDKNYKPANEETIKRLSDYIYETNDVSIANVKVFLEQEKINQQENKEQDVQEVVEVSNINLSLCR